VGEQVVPEQDRLGVLHVRAARHRSVPVRARLIGQGLDEVEEDTAHRADLIPQEHPYERGDLVVARPSCAQLPAQPRTEPLEQAALEAGVHVLVVGRRSVAT